MVTKKSAHQVYSLTLIVSGATDKSANLSLVNVRSFTATLTSKYQLNEGFMVTFT